MIENADGFSRRDFLSFVKHGIGERGAGRGYSCGGDKRAAGRAHCGRGAWTHARTLRLKAKRAIHICLVGALSHVDSY